MARQVRISDENARWLEEQGGSLSAAADRTIQWARDTIDVMYAEEDDPQNPQIAQPVEQPGEDDTPAPPADRPPPLPGSARTSASSARRARGFAVAIRRQW